MLGRTHNMIAFATLATVAIYFPPKVLAVPTFAVCLVANAIGAMLPDADQATCKLWGMLPFGDSVGKVFTHLFLAHRTLSHSLLGLFLVNKLVYWLLPKILNGSYIDYQMVAMSLMIGYVSHLLADSVTEEGLPLFFPFKLKVGFPPIKSWRIKTGHWFEKFVVTPGVIIYTFWIVINHWTVIHTIINLFGVNS